MPDSRRTARGGPPRVTGYLSWAGAAIPARAATLMPVLAGRSCCLSLGLVLLPQQILDQPLPRGLGRMHRHLAGGKSECDQRRAIARDPPDVQIAMSPRAREPGVQFLALGLKLRKLRLVRREVLDDAEEISVLLVCQLGRDYPEQEQLLSMAAQVEDRLILLVGSRSPSEVRINELGEGQSLYMTILSGG